MWILDSRRLELERCRQGMSLEKLASELRMELWQLKVILQSDGRGIDADVIRNLACALGVEPIDISTEE